MGARAESLASKVQDANDKLKATVESSSDAQWKAKVADGDWTQGFTGYHAATSIGMISGMVQALAAGQTMPAISMAQIDEGNAAAAKDHANCTRQEVLDAIEGSSAGAVSMVRGLSDEQLDRKVSLLQGAPEMSVEQVIELLMVGHAAGHTASIVNAR
jgi:hypothetical protein